MEDITKTGPVGLKGLKGVNQQSDPNTDYFNNLIKASGRQVRQAYTPEVSQDIGLRLGEAGYGQSSYDDAIQNVSQLEHINDVRAEQQSSYLKWGAGITKGLALLGTTFLDGTVGFLYGLGRMGYGWAHGESFLKGLSRIYDNEISNALQTFNEAMEELLPNYRTDYEANRAWYKNLGTVNFWADSYLKNMGFMIGAFYSGGVWNKAFKALSILQNGTAAKIVGSTLSAINEGRIEANNMAKDMGELETQQLQDAYKPLLDQIMNEPDRRVQGPDGSLVSEKQLKLAQLQERYQKELASIDERVAQAGLITLAGNIPILTLDNMMFMGKAYARGFKNARALAKGTAKEGTKRGFLNAGEEILKEEALEGVKRQGKKYVWNGTSRGKAALKGILIGLEEGNEEMAQGMISDFAGNIRSYDSPNAYYEAMTNPDAELKTKDFLTSITEGFMNTYGNGDRWEEGAVGFLTHLIGMPTFGRVNNSDHNTYLSRGNVVGMTGGIFGEMSYASHRNKEGQENVDVMNAFVEKMQAQKRHFTQSQSFTDTMDGWAAEDDAFEFKNAEDNDDFAAISRFARAGRLGDLKEMVSQSFDNLSDEELDDIARNTSPYSEGTTTGSNSKGSTGWRNLDGSYMSETEEGRALMREDLEAKKQKILKEIDDYQKSVEIVRAIGNDSLTEDQVNELAWLNWKLGRFNDRFGSIQKENSDLFKALSDELLNWRDAIDEESEEGKKWLKNINSAINFISFLQGSKSALDLANRIAANPKGLKVISSQDFYDYFADKTGLTYSSYNAAMNNLIDAGRLASAAKTFNERYKEFTEDPIKLIKNRQKIDKKKEKINTASENINTINKVRKSTVSDLAAAMRDGSFDPNDFDSMFEGVEGEDAEEQKNKVQEAQAINKGADQLAQAIDEAELEGVDPLEMEEVKRNAKALLEKAREGAESLEELYDTDTEAWLDPRNLPTEDDTIDLDEAQEMVDAARSLAQQEIASLRDAEKAMELVPKSGQAQDMPETETTGHDPVDKTITENERKKKEEEAAAKKKVKVDRTTAYNDGVAAIIASMGLDTLESNLYKDLASDLLTDLNLLLNEGLSKEDIFRVLPNNVTYERLTLDNTDINKVISAYIDAYKSEGTQPKPTTPEPEPRITTPVIEASKAKVTQPKEEDLSKENGVYRYWRPSTTELPIHYKGGEIIPFYKLAKDMGKYTASELQRMEAVYNYLEKNGAFQRVNEGRVKPKDTVGFMIDPALNEKAGDTVILIIDKDGKVIGDLPSRNDRTFKDYVGLAELVDRIEKEYKETGKITVTTQVDKNFVGKVPTTDTYSTLNAISEGKGFTLGIALESGSNPTMLLEGGRTKRSRGGKDDIAIKPANASAGQPFLMLETSSSARHYFPVPIIMKPFSEATQGTRLHRAVENAISNIFSKAARATDVKDDLLDVLALEDAFVEYEDDKVKLRVMRQGKWETLFNGVPTPETVSEVVKKLEGTPYQISRKFINGQYKGQSYNNMVGEIAEANLPIGTRHTVSEWFSLKLNNGQKTVSPKTMGENPHRAESAFVPINYNGLSLKVDTKSWEVSDDKGKVYEGEKTNKVKAHAFGIYKDKDMTKPYDTDWGRYDPIKREFVKPEPVSAPIDNSLFDDDDFDAASAAIEALNAGKEAEPTPTPQVSPEPSTPSVQEQQPIDVQDSAPIQTPSGPTTSSTPLAEVERNKALLREQSKLQAPNPDVAEISSEEAKDKVTKAGLLNTNQRKLVWDKLSEEAQRIIAKARKQKASQWMTALEKAFDIQTGEFNLEKLKDKPQSIEEYLTSKPKNSRVSDRTDRKWNEARERQWLKQALPQLSTEDRLRIHKGLIRISEQDGGGEAYGQFWRGIITIASNAAQGTLYHEAFHAVVDTLLNDQEYELLFKAAEERWGDIGMLALEENMADDFRKYVQLEETPILGKAVKAYRTLKHIVQNLFGKEPFINKVYYNISRGKYANRTLNDSNTSKYSETPYSQEMKSIKESAIKDGTFMKAPNGKPTNLNERQWLQVRTKAFKNWFGDWENNPSKASKVVDENGEPLVVYHGTEYDFTKFKEFEDFEVVENGILNGIITVPNAIYLTNSIDTAKSYVLTKDDLDEWYNDQLEMLYYYKEKNEATDISQSLKDLEKSYQQMQQSIKYNIMPLFVNLRNVTTIDANGKPWNEINIDGNRKSTRTIEEENRDKDGAIIKNVLDFGGHNAHLAIKPSTVFIVNKNTNIKSAVSNVGSFSKTNEDIKYSRVTANEVAQYHRDKLAYGNLKASDRQYLEDRGISKEDYNNMSQKEKEVLFHCR